MSNMYNLDRNNSAPEGGNAGGAWSNGLFGCFTNCGVCIVTYLVPCYTAGKNAEAVGESCFLYGCLSILGPLGIWSRASVRSRIREQKGIAVRFT